MLMLLTLRSDGTTFWNSMSVAPISTAAALQQLASSREAQHHRDRDSSLVQDLDQGPPLPEPQISSRSSFFIVLHEDVSRMVSEQAGFRLRDQALHSCAEGITIVDPSLADNPIVYCNDAFLQMTGYVRETHTTATEASSIRLLLSKL